MPAMPHKAAGPRIEPPVSVPMPPRISPAATAAPVPLLLPAVKCSVFHGLRAGGAGRSKDGPPSANSRVANLPISTVPAAASLSAQAASVLGILSCRKRDWQFVAIFSVATKNLPTNNRHLHSANAVFGERTGYPGRIDCRPREGRDNIY